MKKFKLSKLAAAALISVALPTLAATKYVCDCQTGSGSMTGCVAGSSAANGTASTTPKQSIVDGVAFIASMADGDELDFCKGGAWNVDTPFIIRRTGLTTGITIGSYTSPNWTTSSNTGTWTSVGTNTLTDTSKSWTTNQFAGHGLELVGPFNSSLYVIITSNTSNTLTLAENWRTGHTPQTGQLTKTYSIAAPRPRFVTTTTDGGGAIQFTGSNASNGPYNLQDISVIGPFTTTASRANFGIFMNRGVHDLTMQRINVQGAGSTGVYFGDSADPAETAGLLRNITFKYGQIYDNVEQGALGGVLYQKLLFNSIDNNGYFSTCGNGCHNIYLSNELNPTTGRSGYGYQIIGNTITNNSKTNGTSCAATSLVIHGSVFSIYIAKNAIMETSTTYGGGCYGAIVNSGYTTVEGFRSVVFRDNTIVNMPIPIGGNALPYALIENNNIEFNVSGGDFYGITLPVQNSGALTAGDLADTGATVRNNTFNVTAGNLNLALINFGEFNLNAGSTIKVFNNLGFIGSSVNATHSCYVLGDRSISNFTGWDYNLCFHQGGNGRWGRASDTNSYAALSNAQAAGFDAHGLATDPLFSVTRSLANMYSCAIQSGSPAKNAGSTANGSPLAFGGVTFTGTRSIGACQ